MKLALKSGIQTNQILTNDDEVCIPRLSSISNASWMTQKYRSGHCTGIVRALYGHCTGIVRGLYRDCTGIVRALYGHCTGIGWALAGHCLGIIWA